jgi:ABC-type branched-subunit amino acid transport system substrate-binding protein
MRCSRALAATVTAVAVILIGAALPAASAATGAKPKAADVGITNTQIRLAVIADVDNPVVPGLFKSSVDVMNAWAKSVNKQGGIAGRKVVIDFIDSKLNPNEARNAIIKACSQDFAMVGGAALFLNNVDDMVGCKNAQGNAVGLPDLAGLALDPAEQCAPVQYRAQGISGVRCETKNDNPHVYTINRADSRYYVKKYKNLHGIWLLTSDSPPTRDVETATFQAAIDAGIKKDGEGFYDVSARSPQSALTPFVQVVKNNNSNWVFDGTSYGIMALMRKEAVLQGVNSVKVWACNQGCYDVAYLQQAGADAEGTNAELSSLPFYTEYKSNASLKTLVGALGGVEKLNGNALTSWIAGLLFQDAAGKAIANGGTLTRQSLLDALKTENRFDAQGIIGPTDIGNHGISPCLVVAQVKSGKWVRAYPSKPGTFDCTKSNVITKKAATR